MTNEPIDLLDFSTEINIDEDVRIQYADIIKWGRFVAIASIVLFLIFLVILIVVLNDNPGARMTFSGFRANSMLTWLVMSVVVIIESILLLKFANLSQHALAQNDIDSYNRALLAMKNYFVISGIIGVISCFFTMIAQIN